MISELLTSINVKLLSKMRLEKLCGTLRSTPQDNGLADYETLTCYNSFSVTCGSRSMTMFREDVRKFIAEYERTGKPVTGTNPPINVLRWAYTDIDPSSVDTLIEDVRIAVVMIQQFVKTYAEDAPRAVKALEERFSNDLRLAIIALN